MSKYATLPDIDDQPDVYETADVNEQSQPYLIHNDDDESSEDDNANVVRSHISHQDASNKFKNTIVDTTNTDFSERLTRRKKAMYRTYVRRPPALETDEYEILPKELALQETKLQKFRRLMYEVQELNQELENEDKENAKEEQGISQAQLMSQITYLQTDLGRLYQQFMDVQKGEGEQGDAVSYGKRVDEAKALIKKLEAYKAMAISSPSTENDKAQKTDNESDEHVNGTDANGDVVTYELFYTPEAAKAQQQGRVVDVDERIARIEKLVGTSSGLGFDDIPANLTTTSLLHSLSKLEQQITLLAQPRHLDTVTRRIKVLNSELDRLRDVKSGNGRKDHHHHNYGLSGLPTSITTSSLTATTTTTTVGNSALDGHKDDQVPSLSNTTEEKVNHLFATMEKVDPLLNLTPALLTRLKALQGLHTEAATFGRSLKVISEEQTRMTDELKSLDTTCSMLTQSLKDNEELINKNVSVIDTRMTDLVRRMEAFASNVPPPPSTTLPSANTDTTATPIETERAPSPVDVATGATTDPSPVEVATVIATDPSPSPADATSLTTDEVPIAPTS